MHSWSEGSAQVHCWRDPARCTVGGQTTGLRSWAASTVPCCSRSHRLPGHTSAAGGIPIPLLNAAGKRTAALQLGLLDRQHLDVWGEVYVPPPICWHGPVSMTAACSSMQHVMGTNCSVCVPNHMLTTVLPVGEHEGDHSCLNRQNMTSTCCFQVRGHVLGKFQARVESGTANQAGCMLWGFYEKTPGYFPEARAA